MPLFNASVLLLQDITYDAFVEGYIRFRLRVDVSHMMRADLGFCFSAIDMTWKHRRQLNPKFDLIHLSYILDIF